MPIETVRFDPQRFSAADFEDFYEITGVELMEALDFVVNASQADRIKVQNLPLMTAFLWVVRRQGDPALTYEEVRRDGILEQFDAIEVDEVSPDQIARAQQGRTRRPLPPREPRPTAAERREAARVTSQPARQYGEPPPEGRIPE